MYVKTRSNFKGVKIRWDYMWQARQLKDGMFSSGWMRNQRGYVFMSRSIMRTFHYVGNYCFTYLSYEVLGMINMLQIINNYSAFYDIFYTSPVLSEHTRIMSWLFGDFTCISNQWDSILYPQKTNLPTRYSKAFSKHRDFPQWVNYHMMSNTRY